MLTLGNWLFIGIMFVLTLGVAAVFLSMDYANASSWVITILCIVFIYAIIAGGLMWYNTNTESGMRALKENASNLHGGLEREIIINAEDGREIYRYEGKIDIESDHSDNYILFDDENNKRHIIYYGIQDTVMIIEK